MDREGFKNRMKQYKLAREENPGLKYWEWKDIPKYDEGGDVMGPITLDEWIRQFRKKPNIVENEDDEKLIQLIRKKANNFLHLRNLTNERGLIPFIEEKAIRLSNAGKDTGVRLSTNMLDSIAKYADKANIPLQDALGLVGQESTFGKGYFLDQGPITPSVLVSDWSYSDDLLLVDRTENPYVGLMRAAQQKHDSGGYDKSGRFIIYNPDYIKALRGGLPFADKEAKRLRTDIPVLEHAFKKFKSGKYNPNDPNHTQMVKDRGEALMQSPQIQKWIKENNIKYAEGGEVKDDFLELFGNQIYYKPEETSWWSDLKNWWNDITGMKNYAYGNCATTPSGKHTKECAHYSNSVLRKQGYKNIVGDAWTRAANSGMKKITSGYDGLTKPTVYNEDDAKEYLQSAAENFVNRVDTTNLKPFDVIGLYYPESPNTEKAFNKGAWNETLTHTGHIAIGKDGTHYVVHNVGGHLKMNKLADMLTLDYDYRPVSAYRPKK